MPAYVKKFLPKELPNLSRLSPRRYEKYYLYEGEECSDFIENYTNSFTFTRFCNDSSEKSTKFEITPDEFKCFKANAKKELIFDLYTSDKSNKRIKVYRGTLDGLVVVEVFFETVEEAQSFTASEWMGKEITQTPLGNENDLLQLSRTTFNDLLHLYKKEGTTESISQIADSEESELMTGFKGSTSSII